MIFLSPIQQKLSDAIKHIYDHDIAHEEIALSITRSEFEGEITFIVFPLTRVAKQKPEVIAQTLGDYLKKESQEIVADFNVVKGFLNISLTDSFWIDVLQQISKTPDYGAGNPKNKKVLVEFSSPNTNKPLHLGHVRNILLGWSCAQIQEYAGYDVIKTQIINDRGIAICKSMVAWRLFGNGDTPESTGVKGDHFVGQYYVRFEQAFKDEYENWQSKDTALEIFKKHGKEGQESAAFFKAYKNQYFNEYSELGKQAQELLIKWESGDESAIELWKQMNDWVYEGFEATYNALGVHFDSYYYESDTYLLGKDAIEEGLNKNVFYRKDDSSVWIDLEAEKLDHKLVLRSNGTSVYMTQDIGTAQKRYEDHGAEKMVYVVADEQDYHFKVLFEIMKKLKAPFGEGMYHLSYGMVDLPTGRMKSREGKVVDADDLVEEVIGEAAHQAKERGEAEELSPAERNELYRKVGLGALKYFILKVNPKKRMTFNPAESVDMQGQTGPYIQNAYVRIQSIVRRWKDMKIDAKLSSDYDAIEPAERILIQSLSNFPEELRLASENYDPSGLASYLYSLAKSYHKFYHDVRILGAEDDAAKAFRVFLSQNVASVLKKGMELLGIEMPERM